MQITVCFKVIPDFEKMIPADWQHFATVPDTGYVGSIIGCFDETALELALRLKDDNEPVRCTAVTVGMLPSTIAKKLYAVGFDEVVRIGDGVVEFSPAGVATLLADYLSGHPAELVLAGKQTGFGDSGTVPYLLAARLGWPIVGAVSDCALENDSLLVTHEADCGLCVSRLRLPLVLSAANSETAAALRMVSFSAQMAAGKHPVTTWETMLPKPTPHKLLSQQPIGCRFISGDPATLAAVIAAVAGGEQL